MNPTKNQKPIYKICTTAILLALATVLSLIKIWQMPLGGAVTLLSMLPLCLISVFYGTGWAIAPCILYGGIQMFVTNPFVWGLSPIILVGCIVFDYLLAFGALSLAGLFRQKGTAGCIAGTAVACIARFISHFVSGFVLFTNLKQFELFGNVFSNHPIIYSFCYNGLYMLPETIFTIIATAIIFRSKIVQKVKPT